jgi:hypothetical protein
MLVHQRIRASRDGSLPSRMCSCRLILLNPLPHVGRQERADRKHSSDMFVFLMAQFYVQPIHAMDLHSFQTIGMRHREIKSLCSVEAGRIDPYAFLPANTISP